MRKDNESAEFCPNCFEGIIVKKVCDRCGHSYKAYHTNATVSAHNRKHFRKSDLPKVKDILPSHIEKSRRGT